MSDRPVPERQILAQLRAGAASPPIQRGWDLCLEEVVGEREERLREALRVVAAGDWVEDDPLTIRDFARAALASSPSPPAREIVGNHLQSAGEDLSELAELLVDGSQALALAECALASVDEAVAALFGRGDES